MAAAPFLLGLLLVATGATAAGENGAGDLPHLELPVPATLDSGLIDIMSTSGCGTFGALLGATPNASYMFHQRLEAGGGGLTVFCPEDKAVAAFEPTFRALADSDKIAVLLHHGAAGRYVRARLDGFDWVALRTLAVADNKSQSITVKDDGDTVWVWPCQGCATRVLKSVSSEEAPLAVYLVDAVLLPDYLRQKLDGGYLSWLHCRVPLWGVLCWFVCFLVGLILGAEIYVVRSRKMHIMH